jgi:hypothetical protein
VVAGVSPGAEFLLLAPIRLGEEAQEEEGAAEESLWPLKDADIIELHRDLVE